MVSISTVARMVPLGIPSVAARTRKRRSRAGPPYGFAFRKVKIGSGSLGDQRLCVMEEVEAEIEQGPGNRFAVHQEMLLHQVPSPRAYKQDRGLRVRECTVSLQD